MLSPGSGADPLEHDASVLSVDLCRLCSLEGSTAEKKKRWRNIVRYVIHKKLGVVVHVSREADTGRSVRLNSQPRRPI